MTAVRRRAAAGVLAALSGLCLAPAASAQVVPALGSSGSPGTGANAAAAATTTGSTAAASAGTTGSAATDNGTSTTPAGLPQAFPPTLPTLSPEHALAARERRNVAATARPRMGADGVLHFVQGDGEPTVVRAPYRVCDISLEPGETITDKPDIGDPRWTTHPRISGTGAGRTLHIIVKPSDAGLDANIIVQTDRRTVSVRLVARTNDYMPFVKLDMPDSAGGEAWASVIGGGAATLARASATASAPCDTVPVVWPGVPRRSLPCPPPWA